MDFSLSEERKILSASADKFLQSADGVNKIIDRSQADLAVDPEFWNAAAELGLIEALLPEQAGGLGGEGVDLMVIFELIGKHLVNAPFLSTAILGAMPLWLVDAKKFADQLAAVRTGQMRLALGLYEQNSRYDFRHPETIAQKTAEGAYHLSGHKAVVLGAEQADRIVISAGLSDQPDCVGLFLVARDSDGMKLRGYKTIDAQNAADIWLDNVSAELIVRDGLPVLEQVGAAAALCIAAEAIGLMDVMMSKTTDYMKTRKQFGRTIGSFQVIQHRLVDMLMEIQQARSLTMLAAAQLFEHPEQRDKAVSAAKNLTGRVAKLVAEETIQLHGGIAMCWETDIAHYAKRLTMTDHYFGDSDYHLKQVMAMSLS